jgi:hypothetical protein
MRKQNGQKLYERGRKKKYVEVVRSRVLIPKLRSSSTGSMLLTLLRDFVPGSPTGFGSGFGSGYSRVVWGHPGLGDGSRYLGSALWSSSPAKDLTRLSPSDRKDNGTIGKMGNRLVKPN